MEMLLYREKNGALAFFSASKHVNHWPYLASVKNVPDKYLQIPKVLVPIRNRRLEDHIQLTAFKGGLIPEAISNFVTFSKKMTFHPKLRGVNLFNFFENGTKLKKKSYVINLPSLRGPAFQFSVWKLSSSCHSAMMRFFHTSKLMILFDTNHFFWKLTKSNCLTFNLGSKKV